MAASERWHERTLQDREWLCASFGNLTLVVHSILEEWRVAPLYGSECDCLMSDADTPPEDLPWQRWDRGAKDVKLRFRPVFPDRPVIIRPRSPLNLSPRAKATFYVGIPAFIELTAHSEGQYERLSAWPSEQPSNTWHGTPISGTLCYSVKTRARRQFVPEDWQEMSIISTIEIANTGTHSHPFERLFYETGHLSVFEHEGRLWSNHARIRTGEKSDSLSGVVFASKPVGEATRAVELAPPRQGRVRRSMLKEAFSTFLGVTHPND
ncbi:DUF432 domain-containing protein [Luteolibacter flavescens]|uniref:DUF432 domain-containing protein n=1 Tax=Luteolibacter flavescens TaxID=1859460 RepID=A0ABT3FSA0_9BACT|nr:DUF432 domain-containing protein [Luteolibacter flavescens]MCW1886445.1 DUF432 domain-containing protein [Luteolibacter flavescens]